MNPLPSSPGAAGPIAPPDRVGEPEWTAPALKAAPSATAYRAHGDVDDTDGENRDAAPDASRRPGGAVLTVVAVLAAAFALLYGVALAVASGVFGGAVPHGTVVAGVPIGALSPADAQQVLDERLGPAARAPIPLAIGQTPASLDPSATGLSLDAEGTVQAATRDRTNPLVIIPALFGATHQVAPVPKVNSAALKRALDAFAAVYDTPMVEGGITFNGAVPVVTEPRQGRGFSVAGALTAISNGYLRVAGPISIPVQALSPKATPAALQDALAGLARPAVSAPITLVTGSVTTQLTPAQIGNALSIAPDTSGRMTPRLDGTRLRGYLGASALAQEQPAVNAAFSLGQDGHPLLVPARDGHGFGAATLADAVLPALTAPAPRTAQVPLGPLPAAFTTADAQALGVTDVLASDILPVPAAPNRYAAVQRAAGLVSGSIVRPGETWSFLKTVGALSAANGFAAGSAAQHAGTDPSGGVDTVATGVFDAVFAAGMGDTEHHPHASYIDRYPVGLDAAVVAPSTDLQWTNTGDHPVYLYALYANRSLTVALLGEKAYDQVNVQVSQRTAIIQPSPARGSCAQSPVPGFQVNVTRTLLRGGSQVGAEQFRVTYEPQSALGCYGGSSPGGASGAAPSSGSGSSTSGGGGNGGGSGNGTGSTGGSAPSSAPSPSPTGILGGLIH